jgi:hypothetical protein
MQDGTWSFRDLEGGNGTSRLRGEGTLTATPQGNELALHLSATDVPLEDELRDALQPAMRQVWQVLNPHGIIDLSADVRYVDQTHQFDLSVCAAPRTEACSIEPLSFPYRLEKLRGMLTYSNGRVAFERFRAEHGPVSLTTSGDCRFTPDGGWLLRLEALTVDRLRLDRELMQAIPARLRKALGELNPSGLVSLRGKLDVARGGSPDEPVRSQWDVVLGLEQVSVDSGIRLDNIHGSLALAGGLDGQSFHSGGELALDSLGCKDCQFTQVLGPLWIDDQQLLFGSWVGQRQNQGLVAGGQPPRPLRPLTAKLFGGSLYGDAWLAPGARPRYGLQVTLVDADLAAAARELLLNRQNLRGRLQGTLALSGAGHSRNTWSGRGNIHLRDANVYELPVMISMLKILSVRAPDPNAFSKSDVDFHIQGEHVYFEKINFTGDAISLLGKGEMNFEGETRMTFTPVVGRAEVGIPILRNLFTGASQQLMVIHVGGNIQNPDIRKEAMPGVNQALQNLQGRASDLGR